MKKKAKRKPKPKPLPEFRMSGTDFDRVMGKALGVAPPQKPVAGKRRKR